MKRIAAFALLMFYLFTSTGATLHYHYCMGERADSSIWGNNEKYCGKCGMEKKEAQDAGCCIDEVQWLKIQDDQKATVVQFEISRLQLEVINFVFFDYNTCSSLDIRYAESKTPLRSSDLPTFLLNCVFRI